VLALAAEGNRGTHKELFQQSAKPRFSILDSSMLDSKPLG